MATAMTQPRTTNPQFRDAARKQESMLAAAEKRLLVWMAHRTPLAINSDHLTVLGLVAQLGAGLTYALSSLDIRWLYATIGCIALNWLGDSLDGTLARVRNQQRPRYGFYVDHVIDAFGTVFLLGGLALSGWMSPLVALALMILFLLLSIESYLATYTIGRFHLSHWKFGPTELRLLLIAGNVALLSGKDWIAGGRVRIFDLGGSIGAAGMLLMVIYVSIKHTVELYRSEPLPLRAAAGDRRPTTKD